jgi:hypothetical protein
MKLGEFGLKQRDARKQLGYFGHLAKGINKFCCECVPFRGHGLEFRLEGGAAF